MNRYNAKSVRVRVKNIPASLNAQDSYKALVDGVKSANEALGKYNRLVTKLADKLEPVANSYAELEITLREIFKAAQEQNMEDLMKVISADITSLKITVGEIKKKVVELNNSRIFTYKPTTLDL